MTKITLACTAQTRSGDVQLNLTPKQARKLRKVLKELLDMPFIDTSSEPEPRLLGYYPPKRETPRVVDESLDIPVAGKAVIAELTRRVRDAYDRNDGERFGH